MMETNAADRKSIRRAEKLAKVAETQRGEIITQLMSTIAGRAWVHDQLASCHIFTSSFTGDAISMAFAEGERNAGLRLLNDIMLHCPQQYTLMMQERNQSDAARRTAAEHARIPNGNGRVEASSNNDDSSRDDYPDNGYYNEAGWDDIGDEAQH